MKQKLKIIVALFLSLSLFSVASPLLTVLAQEEFSNYEKPTNTATSLTNDEFIGEDGNVYNSNDLINALKESGVVVELQEVNNNISISRYSAVGELAPYIGWVAAIPGIGKVVITTAGIAVSGVVIFKTGSWVWNQVKAWFSNTDNWTADQYISKKRKAGIRREFPSEYLGKTIKQINADAKKGNARARKAKKLLNDSRWKK